MKTLALIRTFCKVVELESFSEAAAELNLSNAQVSKHIKTLEDYLKIRLLNRTTRKVTETDVGHMCYQRYKKILDDLDDLEVQLSDQRSHPQGVLKISAPVDFTTMYLMRPFNAFKENYPDIQFELHLCDQFVSLIDDGFDMAIRIGRLSDSSLIARKISSTCIRYYASPSYLAKYGTPDTPDDLANHQTLFYLNCQDSKLQTYSRSHTPLLCNNGRAMCEAATFGMGIAVKPDFMAHPYVERGQLREILPGYRTAPIGIFAMYLHRSSSCKITRLIDFLAEYFEHNQPWVNSP